MDFLIVTNNPRVKADFEDAAFYETTPLDLLMEVRRLVHRGHKLISHPLKASSGMMHSHYFSVILTPESEDLDPFHVDIAEGSVEKFRLHNSKKDVSRHREDFSLIDYSLFRSALNEAQISIKI